MSLSSLMIMLLWSWEGEGKKLFLPLHYTTCFRNLVSQVWSRAREIIPAVALYFGSVSKAQCSTSLELGCVTLETLWTSACYQSHHPTHPLCLHRDKCGWLEYQRFGRAKIWIPTLPCKLAWWVTLGQSQSLNPTCGMMRIKWRHKEQCQLFWGEKGSKYEISKINFR